MESNFPTLWLMLARFTSSPFSHPQNYRRAHKLLSTKNVRSFSRLTALHNKSNNEETHSFDVVVVGGGIVGLGAARALKLRVGDSLSVGLLEKEAKVAEHQSSHNSGVIHAGIYYKPGSARATLCSTGMKLAYNYCDTNNIPYKKVGKLIVATNEVERKELKKLYERALANEVPDVKLLSSEDIKKVEPHCVGVEAIHSPHTGIVDWGIVARSFAKDFTNLGGTLITNFKVAGFESTAEGSGDTKEDITSYPVTVTSQDGRRVKANFVLTCAGLYSDKMAALSGGSPEPSIVPFRGEYLVLKPNKLHLVQGNIYPVPDPRFPFLGVHFTPKMDGTILLGPNAVLAFKREGYSYFDVNPKELYETFSNKGFRRLVSKYFSYGVEEMTKSVFISRQVKELQKFIPSIVPSDVERGPSGVRAQALTKEGELVEDFVFEKGGPRILHCRNAPSPAATSSLAIASVLVDKVLNNIDQ